ncbi:MAG: OmpA family protein [Lutibacter sp.]|nr:OmpA family protein [Lutibacter sp.]
MKKYFCIAVMLGFCTVSSGQFIDKLKNKIKTKTTQKADSKVDKKIDETLDNVLNGNVSFPKDNKGNKASENNNETTSHDSKQSVPSFENNNQKTAYKSKFDFIPGDKIILWEDFTEDAIGDFPVNWNTNGSGEVVTIDELGGNWLMMQKNSNFALNELLSLSENFTIQFDVMLTVPFNRLSSPLNFAIGDIKNTGTYINASHHSFNDNNNAVLWIKMHPGQQESNSNGFGNYLMYYNSVSNIVNEKFDLPDFMDVKEKLPLKISIWKQKQRIRVYMNENKIVDLPKILPEDMNVNALIWQTESYQDDNKYFISNLRVSEGTPDTRNKLLTEGKLVSNGILFNVNADIIKPESYGVLKEIAEVLKKNKDINVTIVGHTDSDGEETENQELSLKRANAVKNALIADFNIDNSRMETDGKGETEPLLPNENAVNKANNRRVEFIVIH